jgi:hypothetical protein
MYVRIYTSEEQTRRKSTFIFPHQSTNLAEEDQHQEVRLWSADGIPCSFSKPSQAFPSHITPFGSSIGEKLRKAQEDWLHKDLLQDRE